MLLRSFLLFISLSSQLSSEAITFKRVASSDVASKSDNVPIVFIATLVRNKAHSLPYFLRSIEDLDYPKKRIILWFASDHNVDNSVEILNHWILNNSHLYKTTIKKFSTSPTAYEEEKGIGQWGKSRMLNVIQLRERALTRAREKAADFLFFLDADAILVNNNSLRFLIERQKTVVAPLLTTPMKLSNFWSVLDLGTQRNISTDDVISGSRLGCFQVAAVHSAFLIDLRVASTQKLSFEPAQKELMSDDVSLFASSAAKADVPLSICNRIVFGYIPMPIESNQHLDDERENFLHVKLEHMVLGPNKTYNQPLKPSPFIPVQMPAKTSLGFDKIFVINLVRRVDRRERMEVSLDELGLEVTFTAAVDGKKMTTDYIQELGIQMLPNYLDPYHKRPLNFGEIGCFLSHYFIWKKVVDTNLTRVMVLEDDVRFESHFSMKIRKLLDDVEMTHLDWDLIFIGRKIMRPKEESYIDDIPYLVRPHYTHWTIGYLLSNKGARKLLDENPLKKLVPVDEYLPIMYNRHPIDAWKDQFINRTLNAFAVHPLFIHPTHYYGEPNYVSDTENTPVLHRDEL